MDREEVARIRKEFDKRRGVGGAYGGMLADLERAWALVDSWSKGPYTAQWALFVAAALTGPPDAPGGEGEPETAPPDLAKAAAEASVDYYDESCLGTEDRKDELRKTYQAWVGALARYAEVNCPWWNRGEPRPSEPETAPETQQARKSDDQRDEVVRIVRET